MTAATAPPTRLTLYRDAGSRAGGFVRRAWRRRWVKIVAILLSLPFILYFLLWLLFARGLPSAESLLTYQPPLPSQVRDINGAPVQSYARERRGQLSYGGFPHERADALTPPAGK